MKTILTVSIILNIAFLVIGNNDMKLLNLRGAHHSHQHARGDSNKLSSDIQVSRLLKDEDDIDDYYDDDEPDDNGGDDDDDDYYDDDKNGDVNGGDNDHGGAEKNGDHYNNDDINNDPGAEWGNHDYNDDNEIDEDEHGENDGSDYDYDYDYDYDDDDKIGDDGGDGDNNNYKINDENNDNDYTDNTISTNPMKPRTKNGLIKEDGGDIDDDKFGNTAGIKHEEDEINIDNYISDSKGSPIENNIRSTQIRNYRDGKALLINVHITHHGGTTFCGIMKKIGPAPSFACNGGDNWNFTIPKSGHFPWTFNETSEYIPIVRKHFHMIGWEFGHKHDQPMSETDWENPLLVSVLIVKDPIARQFSGSTNLNNIYGSSDNRTQSAWWEYVQLSGSNNFALDKLSPRPCPSGKDTPLACLEAAQDLVKRFTFVIDIECLDESMAILADQLGWSLPPANQHGHHSHPSSAERLGNETLHEWLRQRNRRDIELYEWAKDRAVLNCSALS